MTSPNETIVAFIKKQPVSIKDSITSGIFLMLPDISEDAPPRTSDGLLNVACEWILQGRTATSKALWAAAACGVIDFHFQGRPPTRDQIAYHAETTDSDFLRELAQQMELKGKQFERAENEWRDLREASLSLSSLRDWEANNRPRQPF